MDISTHILTKRMTQSSLNHYMYLHISTHILTKRMTITSFLIFVALEISTHILTKRMTVLFCSLRPYILFQLTSSRRGWRFCPIECTTRHAISTHILTKRMTMQACPNKYNLTFQLTSSRRGWQLVRSYPSKVFVFQLTSSRRGWLGWFFNLCCRNIISTLILRMRLRAILSEAMQDGLVFQLTSSRRGWLIQNSRESFRSHFNSHPHEEDDNNITNTFNELKNFNSHPHEEDD